MIAREHVAIRQERYVAGSRDRPEVELFTQTHPRHPPFPTGRIDSGEHVWMKWSSGPVVARAIVKDVHELGACARQELRETTRGSGLFDLHDYWDRLPDQLFGLTVYLEQEEWLSDPLYPPRLSRGSSWVIIEPGTATSWPTVPPEEPPPKKGASPGRRPGASLRFAVLRRDNFTCIYCGRKAPDVELHVDHVIPVVAGGDTVETNLRTACRDCNLGKGTSRL